MEKAEISAHEVRAFVALSAAEWMTHRELATTARIAERTARAYAKKWLELGLIDVAEVFPAHRIRWSPNAMKRNASYVRRLTEALAVFGPQRGKD